jgi:putative acetyltransferase
MTPTDSNHLRKEFAVFLKRLAGNSVGAIEWNRFIVTHYADDALEDIRRKVVEFTIGREGGVQWSDREVMQLQFWSRTLSIPNEATVGMRGGSTLRIRPETPDDVTMIEAVTVAAFLEAPHTSHTEQFIVAALRAAGGLTVSLVAEAEGAVVGHVAVSPVTTSDGTPNWFGLGPISVLPAWQGRGVGSALMRAALETLRELGAAGCVVLGEPAFYGRFGFKAEPGLVFPDIPPEYFQVVTFGEATVPRGRVAYHDGFDAQE